jgi:thioredoxin reductase/polyferredoxin
MTPAGDLSFNHEIKEPLIEDLDAQLQQAGIVPTVGRIERIERKGGLLHLHHGSTKRGEPGEITRALRVVVAIGRSGNFRKLGIPGEDKDKVYNRLHDPKEFNGKHVLIVGGGDSALEGAIALTLAGAHVTLSYRKPEFARPKPDNVEKIGQLIADPSADVGVEEPSSERVTTAVTPQMLDPDRTTGSLELQMASGVVRVEDDTVVLRTSDGGEKTMPNDVVFPMIGREPPLDFFRRSGMRITGEWRTSSIISLVLTVALFTLIYQWKKGGTWIPINEWFATNGYFPFAMTGWWQQVFADKASLLGTLHISVGEPGFWYSLAYTLCIGIFGIRRVRRRRTPYVKLQTISLFSVQVIPLFLLPYLILPYMGYNGCFDAGIAKSFADEFFPIVGYGYGREYWRAFGFILAWPLFFWNVFSDQPMIGWLIVSLVQSFVIIPLLIRRWGKGVYCGWICSCGALAETLGDTHRHKMPHGPKWNRLNMIGQFFLLLSFIMLAGRLVSWAVPGTAIGTAFGSMYVGILKGLPGLNYIWFVDLLFAGIIGVGLYFHFSGRVWCRFACPLAALMHIYARFTKFRIFPEKKKCISCNVCTSVCHQGIDIMNFANKGIPMEDPECVRCSACVQNCPTGVLQFGRYGGDGEIIYDRLPASLVQMTEALKH